MIKPRQNHLNILAVSHCRDILDYSYIGDGDTLPASSIETIIDKRTGKQTLTKVEAIEILDNWVIDSPMESKITFNCQRFCELFELEESFTYVLQFMLLMNAHGGFRDFFFQADFMDARWDIDSAFAHLSGMSVSDLHHGLVLLNQIGMLHHTSLNSVTGEEIPPVITDALVTGQIQSKDDLLSTLLDAAPDAQFTLDEFPHVDTNILAEYLVNATNKRIPGINFLLFGGSGSGKTQLARTLAQYGGFSLYEVRAKSGEGQGLNSELQGHHATKTRLQYLALITELLNPEDNAVLLVDECESLFCQADHRYSKETLQRILENNRIPVIWITNHVEELEASFIRRFKLVTEVPAPEGDTLPEVSLQHLIELRLSNPFKQLLADTTNITPAHIANAAHVTRVIKRSGKQAEKSILQVVESSLDASGLLDKPMRYQEEMTFDVGLLNIRQSASELATICRAVKNNHAVRVLLTGPAGTGKTAYAHHLAKQNQRPIKRITGSDVLSKYVGESEQQVAALFQEAHRVGDILLLDEVDSLLSTRDFAKANHEIQLVNELLAQMECFTQPLFAATNYEKHLDKAVLRRFDYKLECDYLRPEQAITLYRQILELRTVSRVDIQSLECLTCLTPGDFALLKRRKRFTPLKSLRTQAIAFLQSEQRRKQHSKPIGFIAN